LVRHCSSAAHRAYHNPDRAGCQSLGIHRCVRHLGQRAVWALLSCPQQRRAGAGASMASARLVWLPGCLHHRAGVLAPVYLTKPGGQSADNISTLCSKIPDLPNVQGKVIELGSGELPSSYGCSCLLPDHHVAECRPTPRCEARSWSVYPQPPTHRVPCGLCQAMQRARLCYPGLHPTQSLVRHGRKGSMEVGVADKCPRFTGLDSAGPTENERNPGATIEHAVLAARSGPAGRCDLAISSARSS